MEHPFPLPCPVLHCFCSTAVESIECDRQYHGEARLAHRNLSCTGQRRCSIQGDWFIFFQQMLMAKIYLHQLIPMALSHNARTRTWKTNTWQDRTTAIYSRILLPILQGLLDGIDKNA